MRESPCWPLEADRAVYVFGSLWWGAASFGFQSGTGCNEATIEGGCGYVGHMAGLSPSHSRWLRQPSLRAHHSSAGLVYIFWTIHGLMQTQPYIRRPGAPGIVQQSLMGTLAWAVPCAPQPPRFPYKTCIHPAASLLGPNTSSRHYIPHANNARAAAAATAAANAAMAPPLLPAPNAAYAGTAEEDNPLLAHIRLLLGHAAGCW